MTAKASPSKKDTDVSADHMFGQPNDLCKVVYVVNVCTEDHNHWWADAVDAKQGVIDELVQFFDATGEQAIDLCFDVALDYGFITTQTDPKTARVRYVTRKRNELDLTHDWFCYECDVLVPPKSPQFLRCDQCFRIF
ncbi:unnamed protein product, partial [Oppiella nova]